MIISFDFFLDQLCSIGLLLFRRPDSVSFTFPHLGPSRASLPTLDSFPSSPFPCLHSTPFSLQCWLIPKHLCHSTLTLFHLPTRRSHHLLSSLCLLSLESCTHQVMKVQNLAVHHDLPSIARQIGLVERPVEWLVRDRLVRRVVVGLEEGVGETLFRVDSGLGVVDEHFGEEVDG